MRIWKIPDQIIRIGAIFIILLLILIVVRYLLVPKTFGKEGHYRADALIEEASKGIKYVGAEACNDCHSDIAESKASSYHKNLSCEVCHEPAVKHVENPTEIKPVKPMNREDCVKCHAYLASRPTGFPQIIEKTHNPGQACISCHDPHEPTPPETPERCSACHANIVRTKSLSPHAKLHCEDCHIVPVEHKQNPRIVKPQIPTNREACLKCHSEQAKSPAAIPRVNSSHYGKYLCWQCHYPHLPEVER